MAHHPLSYPIGQFQAPDKITKTQREAYLKDLRTFPARLTLATVHLNDNQLETPYRPGGWTIRQLVHHLADSHMNAYTRFKLALTEDNPTIRPYDEKGWANLPEASSEPIQVSLTLQESLHRRWTKMIESMSEAEFSRTFFHPADNVSSRLDVALGTYAWHCNHHLAHVTGLIERESWD